MPVRPILLRHPIVITKAKWCRNFNLLPIGYAVRPTARRRGHDTAMLRAGLAVAHDLGIASALITRDVDNIGSRRVIENNGGILEDQHGAKLRDWVPTRSGWAPLS